MGKKTEFLYLNEEEMIEASTAFFSTDNQEILDARKTFAQRKEKYKTH